MAGRKIKISMSKARTMASMLWFRPFTTVSVLGLLPAVLGREETNLELKPERELPDSVPAGVADPRGEDLSECALAGRSRTLSQILARIIDVKPFRDLEVFSQAQGEINGSGANQRPHGSVAKTANHATVGEA